MKIRVIATGDPHNTFIVNADTGERIENVKAVRWEQKVGELPVCHLILLGTECNLIGEAKDMIDMKVEE
jgi:hypothetical protein